MRHMPLLQLLLLVFCFSGCNGATSDTNDVNAGTSRFQQSEGAGQTNDSLQRILDRAISAMGGEAAVKTLRRGTWTATVTGQVPEFEGYFGGEEVELQGYYVLPDKDRRDAFGKDGKSLIMIQNADTLWMRSPDGKEVEIPALPSRYSKPPFALGMLANLVELRDSDNELRFAEKPPDLTDQEVIDVFAHGNWISKLYFDVESGLVMQVDRYIPSPKKSEDMVLTTATFSEYDEFDGVWIATRMEMYQDSKLIFTCIIHDVDLAQEPDPQLFRKPE